MSIIEPTEWGFTAREQAERDVASALRGVRSDRDIPVGIVSDVVRPDAPDGSDAELWLAHAERPDRIEAQAEVATVTGRGGVRFIDVARTVSGLEMAIESARAALVSDDTKAAA